MSTIFNHVANAKWSEWATVYASLLATYTYFADRQGRKFLAKTTVSPGFIGAGPNVKDALILTVSNPGERPITLSGWALRLPSKKQLVFRHAGFLPTSFPNKLEPREVRCLPFSSSSCLRVSQEWHDRQDQA